MESQRDPVPRILDIIFKELGISPEGKDLDGLDLSSRDAVAIGGTLGDIKEAIPTLINIVGNLIKVAFQVQAQVTVIAREGEGDRIGFTQSAFQEAIDMGMEAATKTLLQELQGLMGSKEFRATVTEMNDELKERRLQREQESH